HTKTTSPSTRTAWCGCATGTSRATRPRAGPRAPRPAVRRKSMRIRNDLEESWRIALDALSANKARGALTTLGIVIGIVAVSLTMTAAHGLQTAFRNSFSAVGSDVIYVSRFPWIVMNDFFIYRNRPPLQIRDAEKLAEKLRGRAIVN